MDGSSPSRRGAGEELRPGSSLNRQEREYFNDRAENTAYLIACSVGLITTYDREKSYNAAALVEKSLTSYLKSRYLELNVPTTMAELDTTFSEEAPIYKLLPKKQTPTGIELRNEPMATSSPRRTEVHESKVISQHLAPPELNNSERFFTLPGKKAPIKSVRKRNAEEINKLEKLPGPSPPLTQSEPAVVIESDTDNETTDGPRKKKCKADKKKKSDPKGTQKSASPNKTPTPTGKSNSAPPSQNQDLEVRQEQDGDIQLINEALTSDEEDQAK